MSKRVILVIDDERSICSMLQQYLDKIGFEVKVASHGKAGLDLLLHQKFDVIVCDIKMPEMGGIEVLKAIKKIDQMVPVLMTTGYPTMDTAIEALKQGAYDYLIKPFHLDELGEKIERALASAKLIEENILFSKIVSLHEVSKAISSIHDVEKLFDMIIEYSMRVAQADSGTLLLLDKDDNLTVTRTSYKKDHDSQLSEKDRMKIATWVLDDDEPLFIDHNVDDVPLYEVLEKNQLISSITFPLKSPKRTIGVLNLNRAVGSPSFSNIDLEVVNVLASQASISIDNLVAYKKLSDQHHQTLKAFAFIVEKKDAQTNGHSERVMEFAKMLASRLRLSEEEQEIVKYGGLLHDIGKIGISEQILGKSGPLTEKQKKEIRKHPELGSQILADLPSMKSLLPVIYHHHERYDGTGYPDGIVGESIPIGARIVSIVDAYESMTSDRSYREKIEPQAALKILEQGLGTQFDPYIGKRFIEIMRKKLFYTEKK